MLVPLRKAIELTGLSPNTLRKYADNGTIKASRIGKGQRLYDVSELLGLKGDASGGKPVVCYCRVSSQKQHDDLGRQSAYVRERFPNADIVKEKLTYAYSLDDLRTALDRVEEFVTELRENNG